MRTLAPFLALISGLRAEALSPEVERGVADVPLPVVKAIGAVGFLLLLGAWLVLRRAKGGSPPSF